MVRVFYRRWKGEIPQKNNGVAPGAVTESVQSEREMFVDVPDDGLEAHFIIIISPHSPAGISSGSTGQAGGADSGRAGAVR